MKILHVAETVVGGVGTYLNYLENFDAVENIYLVPCGQEQHLDGHCFTYTKKGRDPISIVKLLRSFIFHYRKINPDVIFLHSSFAGLVRLVGLVIPGIRSKVIYCSHGWSFDMKDKSPRALSAFAWMEKWLSNYTNTIVCISNYEANRAVEIGIDKSRLSVIYNCVSLSEIDAKAEESPTDSAGRYCIFIGRDSCQKGFDLLPDLAGQLPDDMQLVVLGNLSEYQDTSKIKYLGWENKEMVSSLMVGAEFMLMPSRWEGFGYVVIEAFKSGLPVIASNRGALPELIEDDKYGYIFDLDDPCTLKQKINELHKRGGKRKMHDDLIERAKYFSSAKFEVQIKKIYKSISG